jgi:hypothetical protein
MLRVVSNTANAALPHPSLSLFSSPLRSFAKVATKGGSASKDSKKDEDDIIVTEKQYPPGSFHPTKSRRTGLLAIKVN